MHVGGSGCHTRAQRDHSVQLGGALSSSDDATTPVQETDGHLTVAAVAARLGVAASTLRTWDRRYGLGPTQRQAGSHRRYSPDDLARLETMRALTQRGVALADAARMAIRSAPAADAVGEDLDPLTLAAAAVDSGHERLVRALRASVVKVGLIETYSGRLVPALALLAETPRSDVPGHDPEAALAAAFLGVVRERTAAPLAPSTRPDLVLVAAPRESVVAAHVLAGSLHELGLRARVVRDDPEEAERHGRCRDGVALVIELHLDQDRLEPVPRHGTTFHGLLLVGPHAPEVPLAHRVRTLAAALPEAADMVAERLAEA
ncbi:MerR family transcriptional regulator [Serinibacter arcticus]|uniref:MerR family transcriptional regulator n=1 Tax=Serinibacter arcticus TaxID=1655435 RepID=UPI0011B213E6|nr:MerR family transcriptional regulator [Serinibacter arcticus]